MRITWILPASVVCGGNRAVFKYSNRLAEEGHETSIITPFENYPWLEKILLENS